MAAAEFVYHNGSILPQREAALSIEDRGTLFGDGVYEVTRYYAGKPLALQAHLDRFARSLAGIQLEKPAAFADLPAITGELFARNGLTDARAYWQITRGTATRNPLFPADTAPTVLVICYPESPINLDAPPLRMTAMLAEDLRWHCCWIKSLMLLPNVLARNNAKAQGHDDAILHRGPIVTESSSANVIAVRQNTLHTHPTDGAILPGVTRQLVLDLARQEGIAVREEPFTVDELRTADEIMLTGTTLNVAAVTHLDRQPISEGQPGPITLQLHRAITRHIRTTCL